MQRCLNRVPQSARVLQAFGRHERLVRLPSLLPFAHLQPQTARPGVLGAFRFFSVNAFTGVGGKRNMSAEAYQSDTNNDGAEAPVESKTVYVGNIPFNISSAQLAEAFSDCGEVVSARVLVDRDTQRSRGYGFVDFAEAQEAEAALALDKEKEIEGRLVSVMLSTSRAPRTDKSQRQQRETEPTPVLFIGNTGFDATEDDLRSHFSNFGAVKSVRIPRSGDDSKGFAYVEFVDTENAKGVLDDADAIDFDGRVLRLDFARPRTDDGQRRSFGGRDNRQGGGNRKPWEGRGRR